MQSSDLRPRIALELLSAERPEHHTWEPGLRRDTSHLKSFLPVSNLVVNLETSTLAITIRLRTHLRKALQMESAGERTRQNSHR
ncbi:hypothetical protein FRC18_007972 [Serendipita sp. 400]|nr:hypothetical protein FRC18_007972 [Serendipita sp. 400]